MSPRKVPTTSESLVSSPSEALTESPVEPAEGTLLTATTHDEVRQTAPEATEAVADVESESGPIEPDLAVTRPRSVRTSPAAQAANRARRIGGAPQATIDVAKYEAEQSDVDVLSAPAASAKTKTKTKTRRRPSAMTVAASGVALLAVVLVGVNILVWHPWHKSDSSAALREEILSSTKQSAALAITYDYRHMDASAAAAEANLAGQFKIDYTKAMQSLKSDAVKTKTVVTGQVNNAGLVSINSSGTQATVDVYVEETYTNTTETSPTSSLAALQVVTNNVDGKWKIIKLSYLN